jgi:hypothetical protein
VPVPDPSTDCSHRHPPAAMDVDVGFGGWTALRAVIRQPGQTGDAIIHVGRRGATLDVIECPKGSADPDRSPTSKGKKVGSYAGAAGTRHRALFRTADRGSTNGYEPRQRPATLQYCRARPLLTSPHRQRRARRPRSNFDPLAAKAVTFGEIPRSVASLGEVIQAARWATTPPVDRSYGTNDDVIKRSPDALHRLQIEAWIDAVKPRPCPRPAIPRIFEELRPRASGSRQRPRAWRSCASACVPGQHPAHGTRSSSTRCRRSPDGERGPWARDSFDQHPTRGVSPPASVPR